MVLELKSFLKPFPTGLLINLINNFGNMYSKDRHYEDLMRIYNEKLNQLETTKS